MSPHHASRRSLLRQGAALGALGTVGGAGGLGAVGALGAAAHADYVPGHYHGAKLLSTSSHHLVSRFSYGVTPALTASVRAHGGAHDWFTAQLSPGRIRDTAAQRVTSWWPSLTRSPQELWQRNLDNVENGWEVMTTYQRWLLVRRILTQRQVAEVMTEFWMNHLNVPVFADASYIYRFDYDRVVRAHALGRFADLLTAAITHPAMGMYLDNAVSTKAHPNENLGRELLELHTVGRIYSEDDVKSSARILTGYLVDMWNTWDATYQPSQHWTGPVKVLGFSSPNTARDGRPVVAAYLDYLAHHPATAQRLAGLLAAKFVGDDVPSSLVAHLAQVYLANDTRIVPVLQALVASPAFRSRQAKVRDPGEDVVATYRALGVHLAPPTGADDDESACMAIVWQASSLGLTPHSWPRPDGAPLDNESWSSPARLMASTDLHWNMSGGWWPSVGITYRAPEKWLPSRRVRFDVLVDHLAQQVLGRRSWPSLLQASCQIIGVTPDTMIDSSSDLVQWKFPRLLSTILDNPVHLSR